MTVLLRLLRYALETCPEDCDHINSDLAREAINNLRQPYREALFENYVQPLAVARHLHRFPMTDDTVEVFGRLLRGHLLLRYHNGEEWYGAHPLIWDELDRRQHESTGN